MENEAWEEGASWLPSEESARKREGRRRFFPLSLRVGVLRWEREREEVEEFFVFFLDFDAEEEDLTPQSKE